MHPDAEVRLPSETAYVAVLRMAASGIAARLDFTLDEIEDLRMAVSEACSLVLTDATPGGSMTARFYLDRQHIEVRVSADAVEPSVPDTDSFAWQVLTTTATDVTAAAGPDELAVTLTIAATSTRDPA
ncbi:MAG TPA: ATP-binding protein [Marmoricola sp.]|jgi:serine/threonine-protein kinase RsbW|nr:ATP-binding protein [Marmoricola sp.]